MFQSHYSGGRSTDCLSLDVAKIHSEINQLVNHRFLMTAATITAFALIGKSIIPVEEASVDLNWRSNVISYIGFIILLWVLFLQSVKIRAVIRTYSSYLRVNKFSAWESDWWYFRNDRKQKDGEVRLYGCQVARSDLAAHGYIFCGISFITLICGLVLLLHMLKFKISNFLPTFVEHISISVDSAFHVLLFVGIIANVIQIGHFLIRNRTPLYKENDIALAWCKVLNLDCSPYK